MVGSTEVDMYKMSAIGHFFHLVHTCYSGKHSAFVALARHYHTLSGLSLVRKIVGGLKILLAHFLHPQVLAVIDEPW